jgi:hypothetical protein
MYRVGMRKLYGIFATVLDDESRDILGRCVNLL